MGFIAITIVTEVKPEFSGEKITMVYLTDRRFRNMDRGGGKYIFGVLQRIKVYKRRLWIRLLKDALFAIGVFIVFIGIIYAYAGVWPPMVSVEGHSMLPHLKQDDLIIVQGLDRMNVTTYNDALAQGYRTFNDFGDVIIYRPGGDMSKVPIVHRAMYYVDRGRPMWPDGPAAPYAGYITLGDNNFMYDQSSSISRERPIKKEWVLGICKYSIPYLGIVRDLPGMS